MGMEQILFVHDVYGIEFILRSRSITLLTRC